MILLKTIIFVLVFLVLVFSIVTGVNNLTSHAQREQPSIIRRSDEVGSKLEPSDISNGNTSAALKPQMVIKLISSMSSDDISRFPLKDVPKDELLIVLNGLSIQDLFKALENIPAADLADIFNKLPQDKSQAILNRLPSGQSQEILDRLTGELTK
jgi:Mg/Co/Ni transporter MgtE